MKNDPSALARANPAVDALATEIDSLRELDTTGLKNELAAAVTMTGRLILRLAAIVRLLEERGEDLSDLRFGLIAHLRKIAYGQVLPDVVVKFQGFPMLMDRVTSLPLDVQQRMIEGRPVRLVLMDGHTIDHREIDPTLMTRDEIAQAFSRGSLRSDAEQVQFLRSRRPVMEVVASGGHSLEFGAANPNESADPIRAAINEYLSRKGMTVAEFARRARVGYLTAHNYLAGKSEIRSDGMTKLIRAAGIQIKLSAS